MEHTAVIRRFLRREDNYTVGAYFWFEVWNPKELASIVVPVLISGTCLASSLRGLTRSLDHNDFVEIARFRLEEALQRDDFVPTDRMTVEDFNKILAIADASVFFQDMGARALSRSGSL